MLETRRLRLLPAEQNHLDWLHELWTTPEVRRYLWDDIIIPRETVVELLAWSAAAFAEHGYGLWVCVDSDSGSLAGFAAMRPIGDGEPMEILYGFHPDWWGQGLASEAAEAVLAYGFDILGEDVIIGDTDVPNVASAKLMERIGMTCEGEIVRDGLPTRRFRITRGEWDERKRI